MSEYITMIDTGVNRLKAIHDARADRARQRTEGDLWNRLATVIRGVPGQSLAEHHGFCNELRQLDSVQRRTAISERCGEICLNRCEQILAQLEMLSSR